MNIKVYLKPHKEESVRRLHPWIFSGAIHHLTGKVEEGDIVSLYNSESQPIGVGHWANGSIAIRILSFDLVEIDQAFFVSRLLSSWQVRHSAGLLRDGESQSRNNVFRLVHGEGDYLPGLIVDIYGDTAVMQAHSVGMHRQRAIIAEAIIESSRILGYANTLKAVYYKSQLTLPKIQGLNVEDGFIYGSSQSHQVFENGILFLPDWVKGQKTGFFIDQRDNRMLVERYAQFRKVLNAFCYTGGFSLYALRGGASSVDSLDSSAKAMFLANEHVQANFDTSIQSKHISITQDAFDYLEEMPKDKYDMIILDPPAFAKHRKVLRNALIGYRKINALAFDKIAKGGILFTFSCSQAVSKEEFRLAVFTAAATSRRRVRILHQLTQPIDHPINIYHPEGEYLKGLVLEVD